MRKSKAFYAKRLPSSVVMLNNNGGVDMIRIQSTINPCDSSPEEESPCPATPLPTKLILSEELSELLHQQDLEPQKPCTADSLLARTRKEMGLFFGEAMQNALKILP